ncbi:MAG: 2-hydroxyacid dehydrogenase [Bacteroidia bacterium]|nr:2-hydroxyacid dehydrogenase [Bacteroidia bacterium]
MKVAVFSTKSFDREYFNQFNTSGKHELTYFEAPLNQNTTNLSLGFDAVCVFVNDKLDATVIEQLKGNGVGLIALRCAGFNNVDLEAAKEHDIKVVRVPSYSPQAVAEHAVALILTLNRKTHKAYNRIRENNFSLERLTGFDIYGKTVGVIGTGQIGRIFARIMLGFGCKVLAFDLQPSEDLIKAGVIYASFEDLLTDSDIVSLHCPLNPNTRHLLGEKEFEKMKSGSMLINTSRGGLINTTAAIHALKHGQLGYLGIDVYEQEEHLFFRDLSESIIQDDEIARLMTFPNVLITAHQGFFTREALEEITQTTLQNLNDFEAGKELLNAV